MLKGARQGRCTPRMGQTVKTHRSSFFYGRFQDPKDAQGIASALSNFDFFLLSLSSLNFSANRYFGTCPGKKQRSPCRPLLWTLKALSMHYCSVQLNLFVEISFGYWGSVYFPPATMANLADNCFCYGQKKYPLQKEA